jgi:hypothetical protein
MAVHRAFSTLIRLRPAFLGEVYLLCPVKERREVVRTDLFAERSCGGRK